MQLSLDMLVKPGKIYLKICNIGLCFFVQVEVFYEFVLYFLLFLKNGPLRNTVGIFSDL